MEEFTFGVIAAMAHIVGWAVLCITVATVCVYYVGFCAMFYHVFIKTDPEYDLNFKRMGLVALGLPIWIFILYHYFKWLFSL